jgi:hypothetical protein
MSQPGFPVRLAYLEVAVRSVQAQPLPALRIRARSTQKLHQKRRKLLNR